jgi:SAM-dependent methyltransferase
VISREQPGDRADTFAQVETSRVKRLLQEPLRIPGTIVRRLLPNHPRLGYPWIRSTDGSITFREEGFVAAQSPALLLARHHYEVACIRNLLRGMEIGRSLEIGCGYGRLTPTFAEFSAEHIAVDINPTALDKACQAYPDYDFRAGSATELPFLDAQFDLVTTWTVLQHIPPDRIEVACNELRRVLAPGGTLLLCEETRSAGQPVGRRPHTWHRHPDDYQRLLAPLEQTYSSDLAEISRLPGMESPGTVMVWIWRCPPVQPCR